jgi:hypothetical protein
MIPAVIKVLVIGQSVVVTPVDDSDIFTEVLRNTQASPSPHWSPLPGFPCKGQALGRVTLWIALALPQVLVGLRCAFW